MSTLYRSSLGFLLSCFYQGAMTLERVWKRLNGDCRALFFSRIRNKLYLLNSFRKAASPIRPSRNSLSAGY